MMPWMFWPWMVMGGHAPLSGAVSQKGWLDGWVIFPINIQFHVHPPAEKSTPKSE